jgi:hypothetical protein
VIAAQARVEPHDTLLEILGAVDEHLKVYRDRGYASKEEVVDLLLDLRGLIPENPAPAALPEPITHEEWLSVPSDVRGILARIVDLADVADSWPPLVHPLAVRAVGEFE